MIFPQKKFGDLTLSNIPPTSTTSSSTTTSTSSILTTNRRGTGLRRHIYSIIWLFQIIRAESMCLFRTSLSFRVQPRVYRSGSSSSWLGSAWRQSQNPSLARLRLKKVLNFQTKLGFGSKKWRVTS